MICIIIQFVVCNISISSHQYYNIKHLAICGRFCAHNVVDVAVGLEIKTLPTLTTRTLIRYHSPNNLVDYLLTVSTLNAILSSESS